ncbi:MAG: BACON domain-containing protein [Bacteroidales bacterium]|nr:BACON domain-containing protein [Bacteroidales bacterium]
MKFRYILAALFLSLAVGCVQEELGTLSEIQVSESYLAIDVNGGSASLTVNSTGAWQVDPASVPDWLTVSPMSGNAGSSQVTFSAGGTKATNNAEVKFKCADQTQFVNVIQYAVKGEPKILTVPEVVELIRSGDYAGEYFVKGIVCKIDEISPSYGNATFYLSPDGTFKGSYEADGSGDANWFEVYRAYWLNNTKFTTGEEFAIGDEITIFGELTSYKGIPETNQNASYVYAIKKSLVSVTPSAFEVGKDETTVVAKVLYSGDALEFSTDADWLSVTEMSRVKDTTMVSIHVAANDADARTGVITLASSKGKDSSKVTVTVNQAPGFSAFALPFEQSFLDGKGAWETVDVVPMDGVASIWTNDSKYGMKATSTKKGDSQAELISPNIDLSGVSSAVLTFQHVQRFAGNVNDELKLFGSIDNGETWQEILIPVYSSGANWTYVDSGEISLKKFAGNLLILKFVYKSTPDYYATWEIKNLKIVEGEAAITSIAQLNGATVAAETEFTATLTDAVVTYVNGGNAFIEDATGGIQLYLRDHGLVAGQKINGTVTGKTKLYNGYAEATAWDISAATVEEGAEIPCTTLTVSQLLASYLRYQNCMVKLEGVTVTDALVAETNDRNGKIAQDGAELALYAQLKNSIDVPEATGTLIGFPTRYNANLQIGVWESGHFTAE